MVNIIPLQTVPNQSFFIVLDNNEWRFVIKTTNGVTSVSITLNNEVVIENMRVVANTKIIPFAYQEQQSGNFAFVTQNFELPYYTQFGITQLLVYITNAELEAFRAPPTPPITASYFNPIADLPLRFKPQGYVLA